MQKILSFHGMLSRYEQVLAAAGAPLMGLAIRLFVGWQFFKAGLVKIADWEATLGLFRDLYHVPLLSPELAAISGTAGELILPVLLLTGLLTRPAALGLFIVNLLAVLSYPDLWSFECPAALADHFYWGILLLVLVAHGAGKLSLDAWLVARRKLHGAKQSGVARL